MKGGLFLGDLRQVTDPLRIIVSMSVKRSQKEKLLLGAVYEKSIENVGKHMIGALEMGAVDCL